jgi:hypothetical protein
LQALFVNEVKRKEVRRIIYEAFDSYFVLDPTALGTLRIRLSPREPINDMEERNIHAEGVAFHSLGTPIEVTSDGVNPRRNRDTRFSECESWGGTDIMSNKA